MWKAIGDVPPVILERYRSKLWACKVPPVTTVHWDELTWINWIFGQAPEVSAAVAAREDER